MISYLLQVNLCWLISYGLYMLLLSRETFFRLNRFTLLVFLLGGLVLPLFQINFLPESTAAAFTLQPFVMGVQEQLNTPASSGGLSFISLVSLVYWTGVFVMSLRFVFHLFHIFTWIQRGTVERKGDYYLVRTQRLHLPFSFMNYLFWSGQLSLEPEEHRKILAHELAHIRQRHSLDILLIEILGIFNWWSPVWWGINRSIRLQHEYLADAAVTRAHSVKQYGHLLIRQSLSGPELAFANHFIQSYLKKRIHMMTKMKSANRAMARYFLGLPLAFLLMGLLAHPGAALAQGKDKVYSTVEKMPEYPGGQAEMFKFLAGNIKYPESARKNKVQGVVYIGFVVNKKGKIVDIKLKKGFDKDCDAEALRVIKLMPSWTPGEEKGEKVSVEMVLPISFRLE